MEAQQKISHTRNFCTGIYKAQTISTVHANEVVCARVVGVINAEVPNMLDNEQRYN